MIKELKAVGTLKTNVFGLLSPYNFINAAYREENISKCVDNRPTIRTS